MSADKRTMLAAGFDPFPPLQNPHFWHGNGDPHTFGYLPKEKLPKGHDMFSRRQDNLIPNNEYKRD